jgi:SAM-dependent methyltransferase
MKGFVPTPPETVDTMIDLLFQGRSPKPDDTILDPGCGTGEFIDGIIRWCQHRGLALPRITGIELDPRHIPELHAKYDHLESVRVEHADFLTDAQTMFDFIVGNPPYVPITSLSEAEKAQYRARFFTARGRFDLYMLFFQQALRSLSEGGRLILITPEKYLYVESAGPLRNLLATYYIEEIRLLPEDTFGELVTYPTITVLNNAPPRTTRIVRRDGTMVSAQLPPGRDSWLPILEGAAPQRPALTLGDLCLRISCGVATGADSVFVRPVAGLDPALHHFAHPTIAGRELTPTTDDPPRRFAMLIPYDIDGRLLPFEDLGALGSYLMRDDIRPRLLARTCARRKPWYAFHETPALRDIMRPKILCKDITETPRFWVDRSGQIVPRHSVYYIVPSDPGTIDTIVTYLRSSSAHHWLAQNCQRASKGFLRLQSRSLRRLPLPATMAPAAIGTRPRVHAAIQPHQAELPLTRRPPDAHTI